MHNCINIDMKWRMHEAVHKSPTWYAGMTWQSIKDWWDVENKIETIHQFFLGYSFCLKSPSCFRFHSPPLPFGRSFKKAEDYSPLWMAPSSLDGLPVLCCFVNRRFKHLLISITRDIILYNSTLKKLVNFRKNCMEEMVNGLAMPSTI